MPRFVMLQLATGEPYESMLDLTKDHHHAYCLKQGWEYSPRRVFVPYGRWSDRSMAELFMFQSTDEYAEGDVLCFMPTDAMILRSDIDLRLVIPSDVDIAMYGDEKFVNSGFAVLRVSQKLKDFFQRVLAKGCVGTSNDIAYRVSEELLASPEIKCNRLASKWQWHDGPNAPAMDCPEEEAIIRAWHGGSRFNALKAMKVMMLGIQEGVVGV